MSSSMEGTSYETRGEDGLVAGAVVVGLDCLRFFVRTPLVILVGVDDRLRLFELCLFECDRLRLYERECLLLVERGCDRLVSERLRLFERGRDRLVSERLRLFERGRYRLVRERSELGITSSSHLLFLYLHIYSYDIYIECTYIYSS